MLPRGQQLGQRLAMRLGRELAQGQLGVLQRVALGAKGGVAQTRRFLPGTCRTLATVPTRCPIIRATRRSAIARTPGISGAIAAPVLAIAKFATAPGNCRFGLLHAGAVIATHRHHTFRRRFGWRHGFGGHGRLRGRASICRLTRFKRTGSLLNFGGFRNF